MEFWVLVGLFFCFCCCVSFWGFFWGAVGFFFGGGGLPLRRKVMLYLIMHSTHFILWLYGIGQIIHIIKEGLPSLHGLLFQIKIKESFVSSIPETG